MSTPRKIAAWRLEVITPFLNPNLSPKERRELYRRAERDVGPRPLQGGKTEGGRRKRGGRVSRASIRSWVRAYRASGLKGLEPKLRSDCGTIRRKDAAPWTIRGIQLLCEQPARSLTQIEAYLRLEFADYSLSRSSLHRHLRKHAAYPAVQAKLRGRKKKLRDSYEAGRPHECWQLDGKGPISVRLVDGTVTRVHILSIVDDYSRFVLAALVAPAEDTKAATSVFRTAVERWGIADRFQFDRGSAFESGAFRDGLALCGVHRNWVRPRHPEAQGKIEAYHRTLDRWFLQELGAQQVCDLAHLQQMLEAMLALLYNRHFHREIGMSPEERLGGRRSERDLAPGDVRRAFFVEVQSSSHKKTGVVKLGSGAFRVPLAWAGKRGRFLFDPVDDTCAFLIAADGREIALSPSKKRALPSASVRRGTGQLQKLVDLWQGNVRPIAQPGFGLPEVFDALARIVGRPLPSCELDAAQVSDFYRQFGPLAKADFHAACASTARALGTGRPVNAYLEDLARQVQSARANSATLPENSS